MFLSDLSGELTRRQLPCGGWSALVSSAQPALEPTCYSLLVLGFQATNVRDRAYNFLLRRIQTEVGRRLLDTTMTAPG